MFILYVYAYMLIIIIIIKFDECIRAREVKRLEQSNNLKMDALLRYGTDMTKLAEMGKLDPVIGREKEIKRLTQVLLRRRKNNACLVGDPGPGVGKTAIVEALAINIARRSVPDQLIGKRVISIEMSRLLAGAMKLGELEERMRDVVDEVRESEGAIILFLDELHSIIKDGNRDGVPEAATILKPALARGDMKCIGATTMEEYTKCIDTDAALKRRFQSIKVSEPSRDESLDILKGIIHKYQAYHNVTYTPTALTAAVDLSKYYNIRELLLPDKAIDLIDEAGARAQLLRNIHVTNTEIEQVVAECTGIPVGDISAQESKRLINQLEETLKCNLIGQDEAVAAVSRAIHRTRVGIRDETKPIGCFLFTGPTGVGKTEMAKVLAKEYFGSEEAMVRLDMSEFTQYHTVSRLVGSPPGYLDNRDGGQLTEAVRRRPHSLVLFDEIEKAHEKVLNVLLQILDDGRLSDGKGKAINFRNTIVILTSNVGGNSTFKAKLLNRLDQIVVFKPLQKKHMHQILENMICEFRARVEAKKKIRVEVSKWLKERLIFEGYSEQYGARALRSVFASLVEDKLAEEILNRGIVERDNVMMDIALTGEILVVKMGRDENLNTVVNH